MPNRAARRSGDGLNMGFRITLHTDRGVEPYEIVLDNLSALDEADFTKAIASVTGQNMTFFEAFEKISTYTIAAFVWLERRRSEKKLTFQEVLPEVKMRDLGTFEQLGEDDDDVDSPAKVEAGNPEA